MKHPNSTMKDQEVIDLRLSEKWPEISCSFSSGQFDLLRIRLEQIEWTNRDKGRWEGRGNDERMEGRGLTYEEVFGDTKTENS